MYLFSLLIGASIFLSSKLVLYWVVKKAQMRSPGRKINPATVILTDWLHLWTFVVGIIGGILALYSFFMMQGGAGA